VREPGNGNRNRASEGSFWSQFPVPCFPRTQSLLALARSAGGVGIAGEEGYVWIVGDRRETILCGGFEIHPREGRTSSTRIRQVDDVRVIGVPREGPG